MREGWRGKDGHREKDGRVEGSGEKCGRDGEGKMATQRG